LTKLGATTEEAVSKLAGEHKVHPYFPRKPFARNKGTGENPTLKNNLDFHRFLYYPLTLPGE
jgi:hypothetical protein